MRSTISEAADHRLLLVEHRGVVDEAKRVGGRGVVVVVIGEDLRRGAAVAAGDAALDVGRLGALQEDEIGGGGGVLEALGRREGADPQMHGLQAIILHGGAGDARRFDARAAEVVDELVLPVVEQRAAGAEAGAAEIAAGGEVRAGGTDALRIIGDVELHQGAQRQREITVAGRDGRTAVVELDGDAGPLVQVVILVRLAALQVAELAR